MTRRQITALLLAAAFCLPSCDRFRKKVEKVEKTLPAEADPAARSVALGPEAKRTFAQTRPFLGKLFRIIIPLTGDPATKVGREALAVRRRDAAEAVRLSFRELDRLEQKLDASLPGSLVARINRAAAKKRIRPTKLSQEFFNLFHFCVKLSKKTQGAFDISVAPVSRLWSFTPGKNGWAGPPPIVAVRRALQRVGYRGIGLNYDKNTVALKRTGMEVHLGRIAIGYALDQVAWVLRKQRFPNFMLTAGGHLVTSGTNRGRPWKIGLPDPRQPAKAFGHITLKTAAVATTGDYERFVLKGGKRYHHLLDPRTGLPASGAMAVTAVGPKSAEVAALATAAFVLGPKRGFDLLDRTAKVEGLVVTSQGQVLVTKGLKRQVVTRPPTKGP